jgi:predicted dehydrogenase
MGDGNGDMGPRPLRVGIAGTGFIGAVHARSARLAGARLAGVAASTPERSAQAAERMGAERGFESAEALAEAPDVDVVHVCTPNHLHLPIAEAALAAGKHVICEKPLAVDVAGARRLTDLAAGSDASATVPFVYRYYPTVREARERVRSGRTGAIRLLHGTYLQDWLLRAEDDNWRVDADVGGASRAFADIGSHWCDLVEFITGHRIARLSARTLTAVPERLQAGHREAFTAGADDGEARPVTTEDAAMILFETDRGAVGSAVISQVSAGRKNRLWVEVDGADESVAFDQEEPESLWCGRREHATVLRRDPAAMSEPAARLAWLPAGHGQGYGDCFAAFVADSYDAFREGEPVDGLPAFADGLRTAVITDAVLAAAREERWVDVPAHESLEVAP